NRLETACISRPDKPGQFTIAFVGRLDAIKDAMLLVQGFAKFYYRVYRGARLVVVGDGTLRSAMERWARSAGIGGAVSFVRSQPRGRVASVVAAANVVAITSFYGGPSVAALEALALGVPVISTDVGDTSRVVLDGRTGWLVSERAPAAVEHAVSRADRERT